ncbi:hypothetical protein GCM10011579_049660 [Streptomyces albiflavescens]|uniref:Uncharacterized protein n=1 Tax=Streptomyces albiflavescens TaxID=1623582 RepID=A0A917Y7B1_9ACTN|nr:hypothetical protein GCM10011579_049660 [Streptomyces albiflavescens]
MREARGALVGGPHGELRRDPDPLPRAGLQVQSMRLLTATPETLFVVGSEELAGGGRVGVPHRRDGVCGGRQSCGSTTHSRRPYPRVHQLLAPCQA